jgi:Protein of unknown function (DUF2510)
MQNGGSGGSTPTGQPIAGWYADPSDPDLIRYWNGVAWTTHVQRAESLTAQESAVRTPLTLPAQPRTNPLTGHRRYVAAGVVIAIIALSLVVALPHKNRASPRTQHLVHRKGSSQSQLSPEAIGRILAGLPKAATDPTTAPATASPLPSPVTSNPGTARNIVTSPGSIAPQGSGPEVTVPSYTVPPYSVPTAPPNTIPPPPTTVVDRAVQEWWTLNAYRITSLLDDIQNMESDMFTPAFASAHAQFNSDVSGAASAQPIPNAAMEADWQAMVADYQASEPDINYATQWAWNAGGQTFWDEAVNDFSAADLQIESLTEVAQSLGVHG